MKNLFSGGLRTQGITKKSQKILPLITVITVVRNGKKTLENTILSVINQTYNNIEYIVIDGASTDNTLDIIRKYEDKIDYWVSEPDKGTYDAMNKGIGLATGEWINFMNSGDVFFNNNILSNIKFCNISNEVGILYGSILYKSKYENKIMTPLDISKFEYHMPFCHQTVFLRTALIENFDLKYKIAADYNYFYKLYKNNVHFYNLNMPIVIYDGHGISSNPLLLYKEYLSINKGNIIIKINYFKKIIIHYMEKIIPTQIIKQLYKLKKYYKGFN